MFQLKIRAVSKYNMSVTFECPCCKMPVTKSYWEDTPIRNLYARCNGCQTPIPDYETLIRNRKARTFFHLTKKLPNIRGLMGY